MEQEKTIVNSINNKCKNNNMVRTCGGMYGLGLVGALVYFIQHADTIRMGLLGVLKAVVWPALLVYKLLEFLKF